MRWYIACGGVYSDFHVSFFRTDHPHELVLEVIRQCEDFDGERSEMWCWESPPTFGPKEWYGLENFIEENWAVRYYMVDEWGEKEWAAVPTIMLLVAVDLCERGGVLPADAQKLLVLKKELARRAQG